MGIETLALFVIQTSISTYQQRQAKKKAAAARDAALGQDVRESNSASPVPVVYGYTVTSGVRVYSQVSNTFPTGATTNVLPNIQRLTPSTEGNRNEYLLSQHVVSIGDIDSIDNVWVNDNPADTGDFARSMFVHWQNGGTADPVASAFTTERDQNDLFTDFAYATNVYRLDRDDPQYSGVPTPLYFVRGRTVFDPRTNTTVWSNNAALVLLDYLTNSEYGPGWSQTDDIDKPSFIAAANVCGEIVQGPNVSAQTRGRQYPFGAPGETWQNAQIAAGLYDGGANIGISGLHPNPVLPYARAGERSRLLKARIQWNHRYQSGSP